AVDQRNTIDDGGRMARQPGYAESRERLRSEALDPAGEHVDLRERAIARVDRPVKVADVELRGIESMEIGEHLEVVAVHDVLFGRSGVVQIGAAADALE